MGCEGADGSGQCQCLLREAETLIPRARARVNEGGMKSPATLQCPRCGMFGRHASPLECIDALRDRIAVLSFQCEAQRGARSQAPFGGRVLRRDHRIVILDGQRLCLTDAARRVGISPVALHFRLVNRTGNANYGRVDVRAVGADRSKRGAVADARP